MNILIKSKFISRRYKYSLIQAKLKLRTDQCLGLPWRKPLKGAGVMTASNFQLLSESALILLRSTVLKLKAFTGENFT